MRLMRWTHLLLVFGLTGCAPQADGIEAIAEGYVRVSLQLAQHDPSLIEDWRGPDAWRPGPRVPVAELRTRIDTLRQHLDALAPDARWETRRVYLAGQLQALAFAARRLLGESLTIDDQAREEFGVTFSRLDPAAIATIHGSLDTALAGTGALVARIDALKARTVIPDSRRLATLNAALKGCREATRAAVPLVAGEQVTIAFVNGLGWDGFARYEGGNHSRIEINADGPLDVSRALRLACHEGYPGHHVQHLLIEAIGWPELQLWPGFGPHLLFTEGAAEVGADLAFTPAERERLYRDALFPAAGLSPADVPTLTRVDSLVGDLLPVVTDVARQYLNGALPKDRAIERLREEALIPNAEGTLALVERRRARALVYGEGRRAVYAGMATRDLRGLAALFSAATALQ